MRSLLLVAWIAVFPVYAFGQDKENAATSSEDAYSQRGNYFKLPRGSIKPPPVDRGGLGLWFEEVQCELAKRPEVKEEDQRRFADACKAAAPEDDTACNWDHTACLCWTDEACDKIASTYKCGFCHEDGYCYGYKC
jgi:hypothetical protein